MFSSCLDLKFAIANAPSITFDGTVHKNIAYGHHEQQKLDIYQPPNIKDAPVIIFYHGGRWTVGNKDQYKFAGLTLAKKGYVVVLPNTRLYPDVKFPSFVEDTALAMAWTHANIHNYKGQTQNVFVSGHSSGAHMASIAMTDQRYLKKHNMSSKIISGFAGLSGPYDFIPEADDLKDMFGPPDNYKNMQISTFIDGNEPPMLFIHGKKDTAVIMRNLHLAKEAIETKGGIVETHIYDDADHAAPMAALSWVNPDDLDVVNRIDHFFKKHMK